MKKLKKIIRFPEVNYLIGNYRIQSIFDYGLYVIFITDKRNKYRTMYTYEILCRARRKLYKLIKELRKIDYEHYISKNSNDVK